MVSAERRDGAAAIVQVVEPSPDNSSVLLHDAQEDRAYLCRFETQWCFVPTTGTIDATRLTGCHVDHRINDRWSLHLMKKGSMHPDARRLAPWAARALAAELPKRAEAEPSVPPASGGGGGAAELGIPVWWARKSTS